MMEANGIIHKQSNCWQRRSALEKTLLVLCTLAAVTIIALTATLICATAPEKECARAEALTDTNTANHLNAIDAGGVCLTEGCVSAAAKVIENLDDTIDPCDDFYEFACGKFLRDTVIPDEQIAVMSFVTVHDKVQEQLRAIINEEPTANDSKPFAMAKAFNKACLDLDTMEKRGIQPMADMIQKYGGWPTVVGDLWNEHDWKWYDVIGPVLNDGLGVSLLLRMDVTTNQRNSTTRVLDIDQPSLGVDREFLIKGIHDPFVKAYFDFMVDTAVIFGANRTRAEAEMMDALHFEMRLASISVAEENRRNSTTLYNPYTIAELQKQFPFVLWLELINSLMPKGMTVNESETVIADVPNYLTDLGKVLIDTPRRTIANYFMWRIVFQSSDLLTENLRKRTAAYEAAILGKKIEPPRWKKCVSETTSKLSIAVGGLYVRRYFNEDAKQRAIELVNNIRNEFIHILHDVSWMDEETKVAAIEKAQALQNHIGYPDELDDDAKLEQFYKDLDIDANANNMFENVRNVKQFERNFTFNMLREAVNKTDWRMHSMPSMVNAQYSPLENSIQIPAAILQGKFFSADRPRYMNYGAIGQIIGHEITHGFDDQGRQYDLNGNLADWWLADTQKQFLEKAHCIIEQYGNYTDSKTNLTLNGINTQGENIADNGGVKEAYRAYTRWVERNGVEQMLPGLKYNPQQLFWISVAQTWCGVTRNEFNILLITTDVHSPNEFRVIGTISNMRDFANDFNCAAGTRMNPVKKCEVW